MRLAGTVALITGASSGIGAATARALAGEGATPVLSGRHPGRLAHVARQTGGIALQADLAAPDGPQRLADAARNAVPRIDMLVCNAGLGWAGPIETMKSETATELVAVNLLAPIQLARLLAPAMAERRAGHLVFISSIAGAVGVRGEAAYAATKSGLNGFAESLRYELVGSGVGVSVVLPGVVDTPFFQRRGRPYQRRWPAPVSPERVARAITTAVTRDRAVSYVPAWLRTAVWLQGSAPRAFRALAIRFG